jgi:hypothetical protein
VAEQRVLQTLLMRVIAAARFSVVLRPMSVVGLGYGLLPQLWGEAHGVVGAAAAAVRTKSPQFSSNLCEA